ncbi:MAG: response regulator transcription factor [Rhodospirillaceae bacterium]
MTPWDGEPVVCVVDDDDAFRDSLVWLLQTAGHVVVAFSSAEALLARGDPDQPGCMLLDIRMPGMMGLELQSELGRRNYTAPVIFITGHGDVPMAVNAMQKGAFHFLEKPFNDRVLLDVVARAIAADRVQRQARARKAAIAARLGKLTPRERDVMHCVVAGKLNKVTADELGVSIKTVEAHRAQLMKKLGVDSTAELVRMLLEIGDGLGSDRSGRPKS